MIFISYSKKDKDLVGSIVDAIDFRTGYNIWKDTRIRPGASFTHDIDEALKESICVVVFWSKNSVSSDWVIDEASRAKKAGKLIPVRIDDSEPPPGFGALQTIDLFEEPSLPYSGNEGLDKLIGEITRRDKELTDILTRTLSSDESEEYELLRRVASGQKIFLVNAKREDSIFVPLLRNLAIIGFEVLGGNEPEEMSGAEVKPRLEQLDNSDIVLFGILPSMLAREYYMRLIFERRQQRPTFVLLIGSVEISDVVKKYPFLAEIEKEHFIPRRNLDFRLEGQGAKDAWELVRKFVQTAEMRNKR